MKTSLTAAALVAAASLTGTYAMADSDKSFEGSAKDAWITGKIETVYTLNGHLSPFSIDTDVDNGVVHLTGTVESDIDRDLAGELAKNVDGVVEVNNELTVDVDRARDHDGNLDANADGHRDFGSWVDDATTTAAVKTKLLGNSNTKGLQIDVDTEDDVVILSGRVESTAESDLAEQIALNTGDVKEVRNNLVVDRS